MKENLRFYLGNLLNRAGASEFMRLQYVGMARNYLSPVETILKGAWIRRSCTTADFFPIVSDIDLTVLIDLKDLPELITNEKLKPRYLVQDVQILVMPFFQDWLATGGLRNRQIQTWLPLKKSIPLEQPFSVNRSEIAFEIAHEIFLIFTQLAFKIPENNKKAIFKLKLELERLLQFWRTNDETILTISRKEFHQFVCHEELENFLNRHEYFWGELLDSLESPMGEYPLKSLMVQPEEQVTSLFLKIKNREVILVKDLSKYEEITLKNRLNFIATPNFIRLLKGVGVQEQTLLNEVAKRKNSYYVKFNRQRLAHDLVGTLLQDIENESRLYYCFRNNQEFLDSFGWGSAPHWNELKDGPEGKIPWTRKELLRISTANLEVLMQVR